MTLEELSSIKRMLVWSRSFREPSHPLENAFG